ncbi:MAG: DNA primase DnaG [Hadesarchaea archaeon]|nr:DNA primase DnaG [Hadesarchaea archaeon]TDA31154.1 MAG: DNA primase [Hadesarchaea archaeon]
MEEKSLKELVKENAAKKEGESVKDEFGAVKYLIHARMEVNGVVERPDVVGAIFGQVEGLLGEDLDLRELLKSGRIGRIKVELSTNQGKSTGTILIPSSLDKVETAIIAAALETVDRVGPCEARIKTEKIEDVREAKRKYIVERAKEILSKMELETPESQELSEQVKENLRVEELIEYQGLPAGPGVLDSDAVILVEGRADVLNLLRAGIRNALAVEGTSVPKAVVELCKNKTVTAFLDSDRGGDLILKELMQLVKIDYVARPPNGKSVEELTRKEVLKALRNKVPLEEFRGQRRPERTERVPEEKRTELSRLKELLQAMAGSLKAQLLNQDLEKIEELPVRDLKERLARVEGVHTVVLDGIITQEMAELASGRGVKNLVGVQSRVERVPPGLRVLTLRDLEGGR